MATSGSGHERWRRRMGAQLLSGTPASSVDDAVGRVLAVQAQDARGFRLAVRARTEGLAAVDVDRALGERRCLVAWLNRGTLHLVRADDYWWLHQLTTPRMAAAIARRLGQEGVTPALAERGVDVVLRAVRAEGPLTRSQLRERLDDAGVPTAGQALVHVLGAASLHGDLVRGPVVDREQAFVSASVWLGRTPEPIDGDEALRRLARRYVAGHGPAEPSDLAAWAGIALGSARRAFDLAGDELVATELGFASRHGAEPAPAWPAPRLLGPFDPLLHGWASRAEVVGDHATVVTSNGLFRPIALVRGKAVATWSLAGGVLQLAPLEALAGAVRDALVVEAGDVWRYLGLAGEPVVRG